MRIVFSDIDGTFQDLGSGIHDLNTMAVKQLQKQGDRFVFVTGRGFEMVETLVEETGIECDVIFGNGSGMKYQGHPPVLTNCLPVGSLEIVIDVLESEDVFYFLHTDQGVLCKKPQDYQKNFDDLRSKLFGMLEQQGLNIMDFKENYFLESCVHVENMRQEIYSRENLNVLKVELMEASDEKLRKLRELLQTKDTYVFQSFVQTLEVVHPLATKGAAIKRYLESYPQATSYGIGDGENDLPMFETVDVSVAVENASGDVKRICKQKTTSCSEGGVGKFIYDFLID